MQVHNKYFYYQKAIPVETCKKIISLGLSKMVVDEQKGIPKVASTFDNKEKGGESITGEKASEKIMTAGMTREGLRKKGIDDRQAYVRDSEVSWLNDKWLYELFHPYIHQANQRAGWNWEWDFSESFQFTVYHGRKQNGGFYGWHADGQSDWVGAYKSAIKIEDNVWKPAKRKQDGTFLLDGLGKPVPDMDAKNIPIRRNGFLAPGYSDHIAMWDKVRKISMTVNLTDPKNYAGGNLKFDYGPHNPGKRFYTCKEIRPTGSIIIFPSFLYHCVTPVTRGTRYSLVLWSLGKPWR